MTEKTNPTGGSLPRKAETSQPAVRQDLDLDSNRPVKKKFVPGVRQRLAALAKLQQPAPLHEPPPRPRARFLDLRPDGLFPPPDYRWQAALYSIERDDVPPEWVDRWVMLARELLTTDLTRPDISPDLIAVAAARELYETGPFWRQVEVESRLLAAEPFEEIAKKTGLTVATVEAYEALFYAVRHRLGASGAITSQVIGIHSERANHDVGIQLRLMAYTSGPIVLDMMLDAVRNEGVDDGASAEVRERRKLALLNLKLRMMPVSDRNVMRWFRLGALQKELKIRRG